MIRRSGPSGRLSVASEEWSLRALIEERGHQRNKLAEVRLQIGRVMKTSKMGAARPRMRARGDKTCQIQRDLRKRAEFVVTERKHGGRTTPRRSKVVCAEAPAVLRALIGSPAVYRLAPTSMTAHDLLARIVVDPDKMGGKPIIRGRRVTPVMVLNMLATGADRKAVLDAHPVLEPEDIDACLRYAARLIEHAGAEAVAIAAEQRAPPG